MDCTYGDLERVRDKANDESLSWWTIERSCFSHFAICLQQSAAIRIEVNIIDDTRQRQTEAHVRILIRRR